MSERYIAVQTEYANIDDWVVVDLHYRTMGDRTWPKVITPSMHREDASLLAKAKNAQESELSDGPR